MFRVAVNINGEVVYNGLRFATREEAEAHASDVMSRWLLVDSYQIEEVKGVVCACGHDVLHHAGRTVCSFCNCSSYREVEKP